MSWKHYRVGWEVYRRVRRTVRRLTDGIGVSVRCEKIWSAGGDGVPREGVMASLFWPR